MKIRISSWMRGKRFRARLLAWLVFQFFGDGCDYVECIIGLLMEFGMDSGAKGVSTPCIV